MEDERTDDPAENNTDLTETQSRTSEPNPELAEHQSKTADSKSEHQSKTEAGGHTSDQRGTSLTDPVKESFEAERDLYEIATWEVRSYLDVFVVKLISTVSRKRRELLIYFALSLFLGQIIIAGIFILEAPLLGVLSLLSIVPAAALVLTIWSSDPTTREPVSLLAVTFILAVLFASFAAVVNSLLLPGFEMIPLLGIPLFYFLVVGPVEEFVKWLAIRTHAYRSDTFKTVVDGAVYGAVAGLGFAAIENVIYIVFFSVTVTPFQTIIEQQYAISIAVTRSFVGPGHVIFSAWAGFYLGLAKFNWEYRHAIAVKGLLIAAFIHALYNTIVTLVPFTGLGFVLFVSAYFGFWFALLYRKISNYRELYEQREHRSAEAAPAKEV